jgi:glucosyl-dolichyl phosphate glucuronosyltransferase
MAARMDVSVILCTFNRCQRLAKALESVAASQVAGSISWEILVIDNNSNDQTRGAVERLSDRHPGRIHYVFERQQGKSYALNTGIREARGEILAFMDDDVEVDPLWLENLRNAMRDGKWSGVGGRILPEAEFTPPRWLETTRRYALAPLALFDLGLKAGELNEPPFGTNMAFRKEMFSKYGGFRTDLGPQPGSQIRSEDTEFGSRLLSGGERLWYEPSAIVYHPVSLERLQRRYFLVWWFDKARAEIREDGVPRDAKRFFAGIPLLLVRRLAGWSVRWICTFDPRRRFSNKLNVWRVAGAIAECRHQRRQGLRGATKEKPMMVHRSEIPHEEEG